MAEWQLCNEAEVLHSKRKLMDDVDRAYDSVERWQSAGPVLQDRMEIDPALVAGRQLNDVLDDAVKIISKSELAFALGRAVRGLCVETDTWKYSRLSEAVEKFRRCATPEQFRLKLTNRLSRLAGGEGEKGQ